MFTQRHQVDLMLFQRFGCFKQMQQRTSHPTEFGHYERIVWADIGQELIPAWPMQARASHGVGKYFSAPRFLQRIQLRVEVLADTTDASVTDAMRRRGGD